MAHLQTHTPGEACEPWQGTHTSTQVPPCHLCVSGLFSPRKENKVCSLLTHKFAIFADF